MKVRLWCTNGMCGKREETMDIPDDEVEDLDEEGLEEYLDDLAVGFMNNHIDFGFEVLDA